MQTTFITIHGTFVPCRRHFTRLIINRKDACIRYASDSIEDVLEYLLHDVVSKSCWEYFHPDEIPFAKTIHGRGVKLDKAAVLNYCQIRHKNGHWVGCECVFTVVYDILVASTRIYRRDSRSLKRAADASVVRSLFTSSPRDPRYHMLTYISSKFSQFSRTLSHEPRAALFLNRYTRTSTIMFATNGVTEILGVTPQQLVSKSFYYCIQKRCLRDAVRCIESAKANDSIAYLRFWYWNPLQEDMVAGDNDDHTEMADASREEEEEEDSSKLRCGEEESVSPNNLTPQALTNIGPKPEGGSQRGRGNESHTEPEIEIEAVFSPVYANDLFASPWGTNPVFSHPDCCHPSGNTLPPQPTTTSTTNQSTSSRNYPGAPIPSIAAAPKNPAGAVIARGAAGINGSLERYKRGAPMGESQPLGGTAEESASGGQ
ncbi:hypothetical protein M432DRAFT_632599 [Thermoascus aurantiacus ATCC 26904]